MASADPPTGPGPPAKRRKAVKKVASTVAIKAPPIPLLGSTFATMAHTPYWNDEAARWSGKLWLPDSENVQTRRDKHGKTWFHVTTVDSSTAEKGCEIPNDIMASAKAYETSCEAIKDIERDKRRKWKAGKSDGEANDDEPDESEPFKTHKIRVYPTPEQAKVLRRFCGAHRWIYNQCVRAQKTGERPSLKSLRTRFVNNDAVPAWATNIPYDVREDGMRDFKKAWKNASQNVKKSNFKYRSRKRSATDTFSVRRRIINIADDKQSVQFYARFFKKFGVGNAWLATSEPILNPPQSDCKLQWDKRVGGWFLCVPIPLAVKQGDIQALQCKTVALDPGVRNFQTLYDPQRNEVQQWGDNDIGRIVRLCTHLDKLIGKTDTARAALRTASRQERLKAVTRVVNLKRAAGHVRVKIRNLVNDLHHHLAKYLVENYELILLPAFHTSEMVPRKRRKIRRKTVRSMLTWAHYRFQQFLVHKAREYPGRHVALVCEGYTSKCCSRCGAIHWTLGGNKVFKCPRCQTVMPRDANGARGVLLRFLSGVDHQALLRELASLGPGAASRSCESELGGVRSVHTS